MQAKSPCTNHTFLKHSQRLKKSKKWLNIVILKVGKIKLQVGGRTRSQDTPELAFFLPHFKSLWGSVFTGSYQQGPLFLDCLETQGKLAMGVLVCILHAHGSGEVKSSFVFFILLFGLQKAQHLWPLPQAWIEIPLPHSGLLYHTLLAYWLWHLTFPWKLPEGRVYQSWRVPTSRFIPSTVPGI